VSDRLREAKTLLSQGRYREALERCDEVLRESPREADSLALKAQILSYPVPGISNPQMAAGLLESALAREPDSAKLHEALGDVYRDGLGDYARAEAEYSKSIGLDPRNAGVYYAIASLYQHPGVEMTTLDAIAFLRNAVRLEPSNWETRRDLATRLWEAGEVQGAEQEYEVALGCRPGPDARSRDQITIWLEKLREGTAFSKGYRPVIS
jgi:Flp pilus assembly protein TadD